METFSKCTHIGKSEEQFKDYLVLRTRQIFVINYYSFRMQSMRTSKYKSSK